LASKLNDIEDVERHLPGLVRATNEWFRYVTRFFFSPQCHVTLNYSHPRQHLQNP
jgi:inorganic pyrophosphatase